MEEETKTVHLSVSLLERLALSCISSLCLVNTLAREILDEGDHADDAREKINDMIQKGAEAVETYLNIANAISENRYKKVTKGNTDQASVEN